MALDGNTLPPDALLDAASATDAAPQQTIAPVQQSVDVTASPLLAGQAPPTPVVQAPAPQPAITDNRSFTQKLLGGLLSGLAGGASAGRYDTNGGQLGLKQANEADAEYQANIDRQNQIQQQGFRDRLAQQQQQNQNQSSANAQDMHGVQMTMANLNALQAAHRAAFLPQDDQVAYAQNQLALANAYKGLGKNVDEVEDTHGALADYFKAHPDLNTSNVEAIHIPAPDGVAGKVMLVRAGDTSTSLPPATKLALLKRVGFDTTGMTDIPQADFMKIYQAASLENIKQRGESARAAGVQAGENARLKTKLSAGQEPDTPVNAADQAKINALHSGQAITGDFTSGYGGAKEVQRLTNIWLNQYPDDATKVEQFKAQAKQAGEQGVNTSLAAGRTLFAPNGALDQINGLVQSIPRTEIPAVNKFLQTGVYEGGDKHVAAVLSTLPDVQDLLAKFNTGGGSITSDKRIDQAVSQLRTKDNPAQFASQIDALKQLGQARYKGIVGTGDQENKFLSQRYTPDSFGISKQSTSQQAPTATNAQGQKVTWNGSAWLPTP